MTAAPTPLERAQEALQQGRWQDARTLFEAALAADESADAYEGLSWAVWWLNDGAATIRSREAAYRLFRQRGDAVGAARMALWLASDYEDFRGELPVARGWRQRARRLLDGVPAQAEHGWLLLMEGDAALYFQEDTKTARESAEAAIAIGREIGVADVEIMALALQGLALVSEGAVDEGMAHLDEAAASALGGDLSDPAWTSRVLCYLIFACERVRDFGRAAQWCQQMREAADRAQLVFAQAVCRWHYAGVLISRGKWEEAEAQLHDAVGLIEESRPAYKVEGLVRLGDLRRRQGRFDEATEIFTRNEWHPLALLGLAELAMDAGRPRDAEDLIERYLRHVPETNRLQRAAALELRVRVEALLGRHASAAETLKAVRVLSDSVATPPLRASASFSAGMLAAAARQPEQARVHLEDAVSLFERGATPYEAARARLELGHVLVSLGRLDRARTEAAAAERTFEDLGSAFFARRAAALLEDIARRESPDAPGSRGPALTGRQKEVLRLIARGLSDRDIAGALGLSEHTVHRHVSNILLRLDVPTRAAAAAQAAARQLI